MSLFDPYSHIRLRELRQEELARKARRRLDLDAARAATPHTSRLGALAARFKRSSRPAPAAQPTARPALDS